MQKVANLLLILFVIAACQASDEGSLELPNGYVRATVSVVESGIAYADVDAPERLPWGPAGIFSVKDGYAIPDNVRGKIVILNDDFGVTREIDVRDVAQGVLAVVSDGGDLVALDAYAPVPRLLRIGPGNDIKSIDVRMDQLTAPTGLARDDAGLILEFDGGALLYRVEDRDGVLHLDPTDGYVWSEISYSVDKPKNLYSHERIVRIGGRTGVVRVPNHLGSAQIVGPDGDGGVYVIVEDVKHAKTISVEQTLWHFSSTGNALSVAKIPLRERLVYTAHGLALDKNREPIAIVPAPYEVQFWSLVKADPSAITSRKTSPLPEAAGSGQSAGFSTVSQGLFTYNGTCLTSSQMESNANEYLNTSLYLGATNIDNPSPCDEEGYVRRKPRYLETPRTYVSVSYDWGGWDTPTQFSNAMGAGGKAGNTNDSRSYGLTCSYGVDCSGFTARVWGIASGSKPGTSQLATDTYSSIIYGPGYYKGDAFINVGSHMCMYVNINSNGFYLWESVGSPYDRVVYRSALWSYVSGWLSRHSKTHCNY